MHDHYTADIEEEVKDSDHDTADREEEVKDSDHDTADKEEEVKDSDQDTADREEETKIKTQLFGLKSIEMQIIFIASYHSFQSAGGTGCQHCYRFSPTSLRTRVSSVSTVSSIQ